MPVTTKFVLRKNKMRSDGTAPIYLRITANRRTRFKSTGIRVRPRDWNADREEVRKSSELAAAYNDRLREIDIEAKTAALSHSTADAVKAEIEGQTGSASVYFEEFIARLNRRDQFWEKRKFETTLRKLQGALGHEEIDWSEIDRDALERFEKYCREERRNNPNTTRKELSRLRRVIRQAIKEDVLTPADNPFARYDLPKRVPTERRRLTYQEIQALAAVDLEGSSLQLARDAFLLSFYGGGIRFGDLASLRRKNVRDGLLRYRMMKTDRLVEWPLSAQGQSIAEHWADAHDGPFLFPFLVEGDDQDPVIVRRRISSCNVIANRQIKAAAKRAKIKDSDAISFHVARHSFADFARRNSDNLYAVSKVLGHSSLKITEQYLSGFDRDATDKLADDLWGGD